MRCVAASLLLAACAGGAPSWRTGGAPASSAGSVDVRAAPRAPLTFAPDSEPAARYNEPLAAPPHTALGDAVIAAVRAAATQAGVAMPLADARLFQTCVDLAEVVPEDGNARYTLVEFALQRNGIIEPLPRVLILWGDLDSPEEIVKQLAPRLGDLLREGATARLGVGAVRRRSDGIGAVVFALQGSGVSTLPIPRAVPAGGTIAIDAVVAPRYRDPEVFVTYQSGDTQRIDVQPGRPGGFVARVPCAGRIGRQQLEIAASDAAGPTVLANFPVWCGAVPPLTATFEPVTGDPQAVTAAQAERELFADVNRDRVAAGLPVLVWDDAVAVVARAHSEEMRRTGAVAHVSPTTGSVADRVRAAHIQTDVTFENIARAYDIAQAHNGLMNSPGHRANLMSRAVNRIGIGVAMGDNGAGERDVERGMFITQVFTAVRPRIDPAQAVVSVRGKLAAVRPVPSSEALDRLAQRYADGLAAGKSMDAAYQAISGQVKALAPRYLRVERLVTVASDLEGVDGAGLLAGAHGDELGLGVAQGPHPTIGDRALWIVVLFATRRAP